MCIAEYATERDNESARRSPPRAQGIPLHADPRTLSARRKPLSEYIQASTSVGTPLIWGAGGSGDNRTTYEVACSGEPTHYVAPKRTLVCAIVGVTSRLRRVLMCVCVCVCVCVWCDR